MRVYFATDIHGSEVCWRKFLNAGRFYNADTLILGGDVSGKAVVPVVARPGGFLIRQFHGDRVLSLDETVQAETRIGDRGFYPYRTTDDELDEIWDSPEAVQAIFLDLMRRTLARWLDLAEERLAGTGIRLYAMTGNDDPPELQAMLRESPVLTETESDVLDLGEGISMISCGYSNPTPWHTPRELEDDELERRIEKMAVQVQRPERAVFNLHVPPARTAIDKAPALDGSLKPVVKGGAVVMRSVGSEAVRRVLERYQPMLGLHGHIHESRGAVRLGPSLAVNPGSEYGDGVLCGALLELDGKRGVKRYQLPAGLASRQPAG
jgi:Icc-related predicted phosphoesterase